MIRVGLYGVNGHQVHAELMAHPMARLVAVADFPLERLAGIGRGRASIRQHRGLQSLLKDKDVDLVVLCSARRSDQAGDAISALRAGKHVLAEKPCATDEESLDRLLQEVARSGRTFREMNGTAFSWPYTVMHDVVRAGRIGEVVQVIMEKSYPWHDARPSDDDVDGGLIAQCALHGFRLIERVAARRIQAVAAWENANPGLERRAANVFLSLEGGAVASIAANYLNPRESGVWGNDTLRILGTRGTVESSRGGGYTRLLADGQDFGDLGQPGGEQRSYFDALILELSGIQPMPILLEEELRATRWAIRARELARRAGSRSGPSEAAASWHLFD